MRLNAKVTNKNVLFSPEVYLWGGGFEGFNPTPPEISEKFFKPRPDIHIFWHIMEHIYPPVSDSVR